MPALSQGFHKTRIAPTPSGFLHVGNLLSFALTAWLAEESGARLLLRIDDLDSDRVRPEYLADIFNTLRFLGIPWQDGPGDLQAFEAGWSQNHREHLYRQMLAELVGKEKVFACSCSRTALSGVSGDKGYPGTCYSKNIPLDQPGVSWRLKTGDEIICMKTLDGKYKEHMLPPAMKDFIIRKKDGHASYQLASLCDDLHFGIDLVVRGEDLVDSTIAQLYLANALGKTSFNDIAFFHHPLLMQDSRKLSKSAGSTSVRFMREQGWNAGDVFRRVGEIAGVSGVTNDWRSLARLVSEKCE